MAQKQYKVFCPKCQTYTETKSGPFNRWPKITCPGCKHVYSMTDVRLQQVTCEHCEKSVVYDLVKENDCPNCGRSLNVGNELLMVGCPTCSLPLAYRRGDTVAQCPHCQKRFDPTQETAVRRSTMANNAPDVRMNEAMPEDHLIWRHPTHEWPIDACVHPNPGMYTVGVKGDEQLFLATGQSLMLSQTPLRNETANYAGASAPMVQVDIFYVRRNINTQIKWGGGIRIPTITGAWMKYAVTGHLYISHITDPAAFMRTFGFEPDQVLLSEFGRDEKTHYPRRMAEKVRDRVNSVLTPAMQNVCRDLKCSGTNMEYYKDELLKETLRLANDALEEYGLCVSGMTGDCMNQGLDPLWRRLTGLIAWDLGRPVTVHPKGRPLATVDLSISGKVHIEIADEALLSACAEAVKWGEPDRDDGVVSREITAMVQAQLRDRLPSAVQQIINTTECSLVMLENFNGSIVAMANEKLNEMYGFFQSRGLLVKVSGVEIRMSNKSVEYQAYEELESQKILATTRTEKTAVLEDSKRKQQEETTNTAVHGIRQQGRIEEAEHELEIARGARKGELARQGREQELEDQEARDVHELNRKNRVLQNDRDNRIADMEMDEKLCAIAARIESSRLGIREKLDAYARLQRQLDFEDRMKERDVESEARLREDKMRQALQAEDMRTMNDLKYEEARRALELRQKLLEQEAEQLRIRFENERVIAAEQEERQQAREEIEVLRLMLEYLTTQGDQQVTLESLREARAEANRQRETAGRKETAECETRRKSVGQELSQRAAQIAKNVEELQREMDSLQKEFGEVRKSNGVLQTIIHQLNAIRKAVDEGWRRKADNTGKQQSWLDNLMAKAPRRSETRVYEFPNQVICSQCRTKYPASRFECPNCHLPR